LRLLIVTFDPPQNIGGVEGRVRGYVSELTKRGEYVEIEALSADYGFSREAFDGVRLTKSPSGARALPRSFPRTVRLISSGSIDSVFLLSGGITVFGNLLLLYCRLRGKRTAMLLYGKDILQARKRTLGKVLLFGAQLLAGRVVTNSRFTQSLLPSFFRPKMAILYPSVDPRSTTGEDRPRERFTVLFVGRLVKRKGMDDLIEAFGALAPRFPPARLEIVGDGPERQGLEELASRLGLRDRVTFYGSLRGEALFRRYRECEVVAMPSRSMRDDVEGFGTVFLEAGLASKPSVGTFSGGIPEAIVDGETGILVKEGDVRALAAALERLLGDRELGRRLGENARARVLAEFTWERTSRHLVEIMS
jgi:glycosyltransferase involved in cell wall biosynthesis